MHFEGLVHLLIYIGDKNTLELKYYAKIEDAPLSDLSRQDSIKTEKQLMVFYDSRCQDCPSTDRSTGAHFFLDVTIDHFTHVPIPVAQSSAKKYI